VFSLLIFFAVYLLHPQRKPAEHVFIDPPYVIAALDGSAVVSLEVHQTRWQREQLSQKMKLTRREVFHKSTQYSDSQLTRDPLISAYLDSTLYTGSIYCSPFI